MENNNQENTQIIEDISESDLENFDIQNDAEEILDEEIIESKDCDCDDDDDDDDDDDESDEDDDESDDEETNIEEAEINSDEEFMEYAKTVLKKAHGSDYDEKIADKTAKGILKKTDGDYGAALGMLTSGLGEDFIKEEKFEVPYIQKLPGDRRNRTHKQFSNLSSAEKFAKDNYSWVKPTLTYDEEEKILKKAEDDLNKSKSDEKDYKMTISGLPITVSVYRHKLSAADKRSNPNPNGEMDLSKNYMYGLNFEKNYQGIHDPNITKAAENAKKLGLKFNSKTREYEIGEDLDEASQYLKNRKIKKEMKYNEESEMAEEVEIVEEVIAVDCSDIKTLVESEEGLTEEFKEKATTIFEAAVLQKVKTIREEVEAKYETRLAEETQSIKSTLEEQVDSYLTYAAENWIAENAVAIESTLRTEIAENFMQSLKNVFVEHYVEVPESKIDVVSEMETSIAKLQEEANHFEKISEQLAERVESLSREKVIAEVTSGLADTQIEKIKSLVEDVEYLDENTFAKKVNTIKEFYIAKNDNILTEDVEENSYSSKETIVEGEDLEETISPEMQKYLGAISRLAKATTSNL